MNEQRTVSRPECYPSIHPSIHPVSQPISTVSPSFSNFPGSADVFHHVAMFMFRKFCLTGMWFFKPGLGLGRSRVLCKNPGTIFHRVRTVWSVSLMAGFQTDSWCPFQSYSKSSDGSVGILCRYYCLCFWVGILEGLHYLHTTTSLLYIYPPHPTHTPDKRLILS